jgi:hypothetical protein
VHKLIFCSYTQPLLPPELYDHILSFADKPSLAAAACLVSSTFLALSRPHLYRTLSHLILDTDQILEQWVAWNPTSFLLVETLQQKPRLATFVRNLSIEVDFLPDTALDNQTRRMQAYFEHAPSTPQKFSLEGFDEYQARVERLRAGSQAEDALVPFLSLFPSLPSLTLDCHSPVRLAPIWDSLKHLPRLESVVFLNNTWQRRRANFDHPATIFPPSPCFPALRSLSVSVGNGKSEAVEQLKQWSRMRGIDLKVSIRSA